MSGANPAGRARSATIFGAPQQKQQKEPKPVKSLFSKVPIIESSSEERDHKTIPKDKPKTGATATSKPSRSATESSFFQAVATAATPSSLVVKTEWDKKPVHGRKRSEMPQAPLPSALLKTTEARTYKYERVVPAENELRIYQNYDKVGIYDNGALVEEFSNLRSKVTGEHHRIETNENSALEMTPKDEAPITYDVIKRNDGSTYYTYYLGEEGDFGLDSGIQLDSKQIMALWEAIAAEDNKNKIKQNFMKQSCFPDGLKIMFSRVYAEKILLSIQEHTVEPTPEELKARRLAAEKEKKAEAEAEAKKKAESASKTMESVQAAVAKAQGLPPPTSRINQLFVSVTQDFFGVGKKG